MNSEILMLSNGVEFFLNIYKSLLISFTQIVPCSTNGSPFKLAYVFLTCLHYSLNTSLFPGTTKQFRFILFCFIFSPCPGFSSREHLVENCIQKLKSQCWVYSQLLRYRCFLGPCSKRVYVSTLHIYICFCVSLSILNP